VELLKQMDGAKRLALIDRGAEPWRSVNPAAIKILGDQFTKV